MLNSDSGVMLPGVWKLPPSTRSRLSAPVRRGSCNSAIAALVSGPVVTSVISPGLAITVSMMKSTACPGVAGREGGGAGGLNFFSRSPKRATSRFSKWTGASMSALELPTIGRHAPA